MTVYTSPQDPYEEIINKTEPIIFIAGGISNCPDWQSELIAEMDSCNFSIINPRRVGGLSKDGDEARTQINWEQKYLKLATTVIFWFPSESICPITLLELGQCLTRMHYEPLKVIVGVHENYERKFDVFTQAGVAERSALYFDESHVKVVEGWEIFKEEVRRWVQ
jgi:hypothetical protein